MIWAICVLVISAGTVAAGVGYVRTAHAMKGYASTRGTVVARDVVRIGTETSEATFGEGGSFTPKVTYRFTVAGREYVSDRLGYASRSYKHAVAERRLAAIPDEVDVWFDPVDPSHAYIERHRPGVGWVMITGGAVGVIGALVWLTS
jgi:hypothetical protein